MCVEKTAIESIEEGTGIRQLTKLTQVYVHWPLFQDIYPSQRIKPKGMYFKTFYRLCHQHDYYELSYLSSFGASLSPLFAKLNDIKSQVKRVATK